ncbi:hypothetical protein CEUSTIGMA_g5554.t1 [Chlamydomonas eustigma]|uniref:Uncharacterized protein n=1 Tax=Chlamydomonas eustigma TaxID=1157962 RepID=A0A250X5E0_9CHLO|nr:hypothetical protein CEUSTIGMA_g5554.t1 [Chlamydomonas eustigma]|eukprot:GAX78112.1 hypothetical protein CEUSTIGMA_g5554.t1 [Chlamydomonas eustigma]
MVTSPIEEDAREARHKRRAMAPLLKEMAEDSLLVNPAGMCVSSGMSPMEGSAPWTKTARTPQGPASDLLRAASKQEHKTHFPRGQYVHDQEEGSAKKRQCADGSRSDIDPRLQPIPELVQRGADQPSFSISEDLPRDSFARVVQKRRSPVARKADIKSGAFRIVAGCLVGPKGCRPTCLVHKSIPHRKGAASAFKLKLREAKLKELSARMQNGVHGLEAVQIRASSSERTGSEQKRNKLNARALPSTSSDQKLITNGFNISANNPGCKVVDDKLGPHGKSTAAPSTHGKSTAAPSTPKGPVGQAASAPITPQSVDKQGDSHTTKPLPKPKTEAQVNATPTMMRAEPHIHSAEKSATAACSSKPAIGAFSSKASILQSKANSLTTWNGLGGHDRHGSISGTTPPTSHDRHGSISGTTPPTSHDRHGSISGTTPPTSPTSCVPSSLRLQMKMLNKSLVIKSSTSAPKSSIKNTRECERPVVSSSGKMTQHGTTDESRRKRPAIALAPPAPVVKRQTHHVDMPPAATRTLARGGSSKQGDRGREICFMMHQHDESSCKVTEVVAAASNHRVDENIEDLRRVSAAGEGLTSPSCQGAAVLASSLVSDENADDVLNQSGVEDSLGETMGNITTESLPVQVMTAAAKETSSLGHSSQPSTSGPSQGSKSVMGGLGSDTDALRREGEKQLFSMRSYGDAAAKGTVALASSIVEGMKGGRGQVDAPHKAPDGDHAVAGTRQVPGTESQTQAGARQVPGTESQTQAGARQVPGTESQTQAGARQVPCQEEGSGAFQQNILYKDKGVFKPQCQGSSADGACLSSSSPTNSSSGGSMAALTEQMQQNALKLDSCQHIEDITRIAAMTGPRATSNQPVLMSSGVDGDVVCFAGSLGGGGAGCYMQHSNHAVAGRVYPVGQIVWLPTVPTPPLLTCSIPSVNLPPGATYIRHYYDVEPANQSLRILTKPKDQQHQRQMHQMPLPYSALQATAGGAFQTHIQVKNAVQPAIIQLLPSPHVLEAKDDGRADGTVEDSRHLHHLMSASNDFKQHLIKGGSQIHPQMFMQVGPGLYKPVTLHQPVSLHQPVTLHQPSQVPAALRTQQSHHPGPLPAPVGMYRVSMSQPFSTEVSLGHTDSSHYLTAKHHQGYSAVCQPLSASNQHQQSIGVSSSEWFGQNYLPAAGISTNDQLLSATNQLTNDQLLNSWPHLSVETRTAPHDAGVGPFFAEAASRQMPSVNSAQQTSLLQSQLQGSPNWISSAVSGGSRDAAVPHFMINPQWLQPNHGTSHLGMPEMDGDSIALRNHLWHHSDMAPGLQQQQQQGHLMPMRARGSDPH